MRSLLALVAAAAVVLGPGGVDAKAHDSPYADMVRSWYHRYLHRAPDPGGLHTWVSALRGGSSPEEVQANILASEEYFCQHGHSDVGFVAGLYADVLGRGARPEEVEDWLCRLRRLDCRTQLSREFLAAAGPELYRHAGHGGRHLPLVEARPVVVRPVAPPVVVPSRGVRISFGYAGR